MLLTSESWAPGRLRELENKQEIFETEILESSGERDLSRSQTNGDLMLGSEKKYQPPLPFKNFRWGVPDTESAGRGGRGTEWAQLPWWLRIGKESACQCRGPSFNPWVGKIPWRRKWQSLPVFLPGESCGQRSLAG